MMFIFLMFGLGCLIMGFGLGCKANAWYVINKLSKDGIIDEDGEYVNIA